MKLFLISKDESKLNEDIYREPVRVEYDDKILKNLFDMKSLYDIVIVSKSYVDSFGVNLVSKALKTLYKIQEYQIIYISYESDYDLFVSYMKETNIIFIKQDIGRLTVRLINEILQYPKPEVDQRFIDRVVIGKYRNLVEEYFRISNPSAREQYIRINKDGLVTALSSLIDVSLEDEALRFKLDELNGRVLVAEKTSDNYLRKILNLQEKIDYKNQRINDLENQIISYKDNIDIFNNYYDETKILHKSENNNIILYFKELEDIDFFRFYEVIFQYLEIRGYYVKSLILTDKDYYNYAAQGYKRCLDNISTAFLAECDKLLRIGPAKKLLELITAKQFKIQIFMIFDRTRDLKLYIDSDMLVSFYIGKYRCRYLNIDIPDSIFISPYEGDWSNLSKLLIPFEAKITTLGYETLANRHPFMSYINSIVQDLQNYQKGRI